MKKQTFFLIIFCIFLTIFLLLFSYKTVLSLSSLSTNQQTTINYLQKNQPLALNYTSQELSHLEDVKRVMNYSDYFFYLSLFVCTLILTYYKRNKTQLTKLFFSGGLTTIISTLTISIFSLLSFNFAFTLFHKLFFPQGNWQFSINSLLIQTFPLEFFVRMSFFIIGLTLILGIFIVVVVYKYKNNSLITFK